MADYIERSPDSEDERHLYATRRCAATFSVAAETRERHGDTATAEMYAEWSIGFRARSLGLAQRLAEGLGLRDIPRANQAGITQLEVRLRERAVRAVFIANDPVLSSDVRTCRDLVDELDL